MESSSELEEDYTIIRGLLPGEVYEFKVVAVDGEFMTESQAEEIETYTVGKNQPTFLRRKMQEKSILIVNVGIYR